MGGTSRGPSSPASPPAISRTDAEKQRGGTPLRRPSYFTLIGAVKVARRCSAVACRWCSRRTACCPRRARCRPHRSRRRRRCRPRCSRRLAGLRSGPAPSRESPVPQSGQAGCRWRRICSRRFHFRRGGIAGHTAQLRGLVLVTGHEGVHAAHAPAKGGRPLPRLEVVGLRRAARTGVQVNDGAVALHACRCRPDTGRWRRCRPAGSGKLLSAPNTPSMGLCTLTFGVFQSLSSPSMVYLVFVTSLLRIEIRARLRRGGLTGGVRVTRR